MKSTVILRSTLFLVILNISTFARAEPEIVASLDWSDAQVPELTVLHHDPNEGPVLEVNVNRREIFSLWSVDRPQVGSEAHAIRGRIRIEAVSGNAKFAMWTCFGDDSDWYSRMPISANPSVELSEWIDFEVPFDLGGDYELRYPPNKMLLTLDLPEGGLLWISNLDLVYYSE